MKVEYKSSLLLLLYTFSLSYTWYYWTKKLKFCIFRNFTCILYYNWLLPLSKQCDCSEQAYDTIWHHTEQQYMPLTVVQVRLCAATCRSILLAHNRMEQSDL